MAADSVSCHGWLVLDKPEGMGSTTAVSRLRRIFDCRKAGHAGTLDPFAEGVLPVAFGEATKTVPYVMGGTKVYRFTAAWGEARDTDDVTGRVTAVSPHRPSRAEIEAALSGFTGEILQRPPDYSAVHVGGERAHSLARRGVELQIPARRVRVDALRLVAGDGAETEFEMTCGKGVYVRAIIRDLGERLGCFGHAVRLRRVRSGPFDESQAWALDKIEKICDTADRCAILLPVSAGLVDIPAAEITESEARLLRQGQAIPAAVGLPGGAAVWASRKGSPVAVCHIGEGQLRPSRVFGLPDRPGE